MPNKTQHTQPNKTPPQGTRGSDIGKDTDNDGRVVQPGHIAGDVDGARQRSAQGYIGKDTDGDGRVVKPGRRPGEIDGDKQKH